MHFDGHPLWAAILLNYLVANGHASKDCSAVTFDVEATAEHYVWESPPDDADELALVRFHEDALWGGPPAQVKGTEMVSGSFQIKGTFCRQDQQIASQGVPGQTLMGANQSNVLQILLPGSTCHKGVWSCYGYDKECDWQAYFASQGHFTLALDRLGTGESSRPEDTLGTTQGAIQVEILHQIIHAIRNGESLPAALSGKHFDKIILGGFSYGSLLGLGLSSRHPDDVDAYVLTGFSGRLHLPAAVLLMHFIPAKRLTDKVELSGLPLGYMTAATEATSINAQFRGEYSPELARIDWLNRDVTTPGEIASLGQLLTISDYQGPVMVVAGDNDDIFCNAKSGTCAESLLATKAFFPKSSRFSTFAAPNTAHEVLLHDSAPEVHRVVHDWLKEVL